MARRNPRPCATPRCPNLIVRGGSICEYCAGKNLEHEREVLSSRVVRGAHQVKYPTRTPSPSRRGYGPIWQRQSKEYLMRHPWCVRCGRPASEVDHIVPKLQGGTNDEDNLQAMCKSCHTKKGNEDRRRILAKANKHG